MRWFLGAILLLAAALALGLGLLAYAMYALLGVMLFSRLLSRSWAESLVAQRQCNRVSANIGETVAVVVSIENRGWLPIAWVLLEDVLPRQALSAPPVRLRVVGSRLGLMMFRAGGQKTIYYQLKCEARGYFQIGPLVLETGDLFGLDRRYRVVTSPHFLLVYPEVVTLEGYDVASQRPIGEVRITHRLFEDPTRISGVREYLPGDPLHRVHWRATARTGVLHSKMYEPSTITGATVVLEFNQAAYPARFEPFRSELAVTAAASLANAVYEMGQQVGLVTNGRDAADRIRQEGWEHDPRTRSAALATAQMRPRSERLQPLVVETGRGAEQFLRIRETLARVELTDGLSFAELLMETASRMPRDATVVALLPSVSPETAIALGSLRRRGFAVTAIVNVYDADEFDEAAGRLLAEGIQARHLKDKEGIVTVCRDYVLR